MTLPGLFCVARALIQRSKQLVKQQRNGGVVALVHVDMVDRVLVGNPVQGFVREAVQLHVDVVERVDLRVNHDGDDHCHHMERPHQQ